MKSVSTIVPLIRKNLFSQRRFCARVHNYSTEGAPTAKKLDDLFLNAEVQRILKKITCLDYEKVFAVKPNPQATQPFKYEFVTDKQLKELQDAVATKAVEKLQMPPVMEIREPINEVMSYDPELQGYLRHKLIFIDLSPNLYRRDRMVTIRELDGTLRKGTWDEHKRMNQTFFPIPGQELETPPMFESKNLELVLKEGSYKFILDSACAQFEPDDPEYHRVTKATYEHIKKKKMFHVLRSTRHFGPMAFYFAYNKNIDPLLTDMIERQLIGDASDMIRLLYILHPELKNSTESEANEVEFIQNYIKNHSTNAADLELRLQTYLELQQQPNLQQVEAAA